MKQFCLRSLAVAGVLLAAFGCRVQYTVEDVGGVPRLTFGGEVIRARMLYVSPTYFTPVTADQKPLVAEWRDISFDVRELGRPADDVVMHFRIPVKPNEYFISRFEIVEKTTGRKVYTLPFDGESPDPRVTFWCAGKGKEIPFLLENSTIDGASNGALHVSIEKESSLLKGLHVYFKGIKLEADKRYVARFRARASRMSAPLPFKYSMYEKRDGAYTQIAPLGKSNVEPQVKLAKDAGVDIVTFPVQAADFFVKAGETPNYSNLDSALTLITESNPEAKILVRIRFYPPPWWLRENPDSTLTYFDGRRSNLHASISSPKFRQDSQNALRMVIDYAEEKFGKNVIGYHPGGGNSCEWFYGDSWSSKWQGYDKSTAAAWKRWLRKKYQSDGALQRAWNNSKAQIDSEEVPTKQEREKPDFLINPKTEKRIADFNEFWQDEMVDMIDCLATVIREKVPQKLCVFFYGYAGEFSGMHNGVSYSGHIGLGKLLKNDKIDALCGPISYFDRKFGDGKTTMGATESIMRAGKLWIDEDDTSTYLAPKTGSYPGAEPGLDTREKTLDVLTRNMAHEAVRNIGSWWMDLGGGGWFNAPKLWELKARFKTIEDDMIANPSPYEPEIALLFDETSGLYGAARGTSRLMTTLFGRARGELNRAGAPFGHYLLDDFLFGKPTKSKLDIYAVAYALDKRKRDAIRTRAKDVAAIFAWAPGYIDLDTSEFSGAAVEETTGFRVENIQSGSIPAMAFATEAGKKIGLPESFGIEARRRFPNPLFSPTLANGDVVFANYRDGEPAVVLRGKTLFCGTAVIPANLYREMARIAGVRVYTDSPAAVYANGAYIHVTPTDIPDGEARTVRVNVHSAAEIFDALTGKSLGMGPKISFEMKKGESKILRLGNGN